MTVKKQLEDEGVPSGCATLPYFKGSHVHRSDCHNQGELIRKQIKTLSEDKNHGIYT